jgi:serine O-acetyltransferase
MFVSVMTARRAATAPWECFRADRARYSSSAWLTERALWALAAYRFGQAVKSAPAPARHALRPLHRAVELVVQILTNIEIGAEARIGPGLMIHHTGIVVNGAVVIGAECTLGVGNVLGNRTDHRCPVLGDRVTLGAGAQVLGGVNVGDDVTIGAMSLVISDVPAGATVAGVPARVLPQR